MEPGIALSEAKVLKPSLRRQMRWRHGLLLLCVLAPLVAWKVAAYRYSYIPVQSQMIPHPYPQNGQSVAGITFSPDGQLLAVADMQGGISFWTVPQLHCERRFDAPLDDSTANVMRWTLNSQRLLVGDSRTIKQWDVSGGKFLTMSVKFPVRFPEAVKRGYGDGYDYHAISPSGTLVAGATGVGGIAVWKMQTGQKLFSVSALPRGKNGYPIDFCDVAFSPDDRYVAITSLYGDDSIADAPLDIVIRDAQSGHIVRKWQWKQAVYVKTDEGSGGNLRDTGVLFSPDGKLLVTADTHKVAVWDVNTGNLKCTMSEIEPGLEGGPKRLVFLNKDHLLAGCGWGDFVPVWDVDTGNLKQLFHADPFTSALALSDDSKWLVTGGSTNIGEGRLELWDVSRLQR